MPQKQPPARIAFSVVTPVGQSAARRYSRTTSRRGVGSGGRVRGLLVHRGEGAVPDFADHRGQFLDAFRAGGDRRQADRSEEHTSELQSREKLVCRVRLDKKKSTRS